MYRHDNFPDINWRGISTYPKHFHNGSQDAVEASHIQDNSVAGLNQFMVFVRCKLAKDVAEIP